MFNATSVQRRLPSGAPLRRGFTCVEAIVYSGVERRTLLPTGAFPLQAHQGTHVLFDRGELDDRFERLTAAEAATGDASPPDDIALLAQQNDTRNGRPFIEKGAMRWADKLPGSRRRRNLASRQVVERNSISPTRLRQSCRSISTETYLLKSLMPHIGKLQLHQIHDLSLAPYIQGRLGSGRKHKTINLALGVVRRILNLAAKTWRDEGGLTWLEHAPSISMLPLVGHQREPRPLTGRISETSALPAHLARMALFSLNTGVRDDVVCSLRWDWEIRVPELGVSVFEVPREHVKGRRRSRGWCATA